MTIQRIEIDPDEPQICFKCWTEHKFSAFDMDLVEVRKLVHTDPNECIWCHGPIEFHSNR